MYRKILQPKLETTGEIGKICGGHFMCIACRFIHGAN